jgi:AraC family transcriptional regulator
MTSERLMQALNNTIASLGQPVLVRPIGNPSASEAAIARWRHGAGLVEIPPSDTIQIVMSLIDGRDARARLHGGLADQVRGGSISVSSQWKARAYRSGAKQTSSRSSLQQSFAEATLDTHYTLPPLFDLRDPRMQALVMRILVGSARQNPDDLLMVDEGLHGLALLIDGHATSWRARMTSPALFRGGLAPAAFRRVDDMIGNALDEAGSPTLAELASAGNLSVTHFVRAFRTTTGATPHQYLVQRRMERALSLLRVSSATVAEIGDDVGFSTPAHFVATFRTAMGVTPGAVRDALAG